MANDPHEIIDTGLLVDRKRRAVARAVAGADFLMERAAEDLAERLATVGRRFEKAAALFCVTPAARDAVLASGKADVAVRIEADAAFLGGGEGIVATPGHVPLDPASIGLAVSLLSLQDENDIPGMLVQIRRTLKPDGLFLAALLGGDTLSELRRALLEAELAVAGGASPRVSPVADMPELAGLLQRAGFALPVVDSDVITVTYADMFRLMADLRGMGETNAVAARSRHPARRALFLDAAARYRDAHGDTEGRVPATFQVVYLTAWAPGPGQPQPLKPGSAAHRLAEALRTEEQVPGEGETREP